MQALLEPFGQTQRTLAHCHQVGQSVKHPEEHPQFWAEIVPAELEVQMGQTAVPNTSQDVVELSDFQLNRTPSTLQVACAGLWECQCTLVLSLRQNNSLGAL
eukprot:2499461-Rhodomonas_salina.2